MKIQKIRMANEAEKKKLIAVRRRTSTNELDKPPC